MNGKDREQINKPYVEFKIGKSNASGRLPSAVVPNTTTGYRWRTRPKADLQLYERLDKEPGCHPTAIQINLSV